MSDRVASATHPLSLACRAAVSSESTKSPNSFIGMCTCERRHSHVTPTLIHTFTHIVHMSWSRHSHIHKHGTHDVEQAVRDGQAQHRSTSRNTSPSLRHRRRKASRRLCTRSSLRRADPDAMLYNYKSDHAIESGCQMRTQPSVTHSWDLK